MGKRESALKNLRIEEDVKSKNLLISICSLVEESGKLRNYKPTPNLADKIDLLDNVNEFLR